MIKLKKTEIKKSDSEEDTEPEEKEEKNLNANPYLQQGGLECRGGQEERNFAINHPTITIEGCGEECSKIAVEKYSGPVAATIRVDQILKDIAELIPKSREDLEKMG